MSLDIRKPTLLLDRDRMRRNIAAMSGKARRSPVVFRPHFKTHQSTAIGEDFRRQGVTAITVSSVEMAERFARAGWQDITIAFPVNLLEVREIHALAGRVSLGLLVESEEAVDFLKANLAEPVSIWIEVDTGSHRTGVPAADLETILRLVRRMEGSRTLCLRGLLSHVGHPAQRTSREVVLRLHREEAVTLNRIRDFLAARGIGPVLLSVGDTPACSLVERFEGVDEVRPGTFVFYDLTQLAIGSCTEEQIALAVACPVVAKHRERMEVALYGGAVHLSKDFVEEAGVRKYGVPAERLSGGGWGRLLEGSYVHSLSQEHGILKADARAFEAARIGDWIPVIPAHCCLAAHQLREYLSLDGERL
jgi:D-serine deaminase-like pyridoxal phosphate-dependent protein